MVRANLHTVVAAHCAVVRVGDRGACRGRVPHVNIVGAEGDALLRALA